MDQSPRRRRAGPRAAGLALILATAAAIAWANLPGDGYLEVWRTTVHVGVGDHDAAFSLRELVNNGLMTIFFFAVGLDVRRELSVGELTTWRKAVIPTVAAVVGLVVPALVFVVLNQDSGQLHAWAAVISTDTAFLLAALALVAPTAPRRLTVFLLALSVVDDIGALTVLAVFYTSDFRLVPLLVAAGTLVLTSYAGRLPLVWRRPTYAILWLATWVALLASGIEPTLAGVAIALVLPAALPDRERAKDVRDRAAVFERAPDTRAARDIARSVRQTISVNERLQAAVAPWVSFVVLPAFALANAGLTISGEVVAGAARSPVTWGIVAALVVGKLVGVFGSTVLLKVLGIGDFGPGLDYRRLAGGSALCGIGFTISLYVIDMAISDTTVQNEARLGILVAGLTATLLAVGAFRLPRRPAVRREGARAPHRDAGSVRRVDLRREFENPCPHLKTLSLRRSHGFYKRDRRPSHPSVVDSRGPMVRSLGMVQTLLRPDQVDDLVARYLDGAALVELASLFGIHRRTVAEHLTRRKVPIRRGRFDHSRIHEAADLYGSGLTLVEVGLKVGAGPQAVRRALAEHGVPIRDGGGRRSRMAPAS